MRYLFLLFSAYMLITPFEQLSAQTIQLSTLGFSDDNTAIFLQALNDPTFDTIIVDRQAQDWLVGPIVTFGVSDKTIIFEEGVVVRAIPGAFNDPQARLFNFRNANGISLIGYGATIAMNKAEYAALDDSEYRHALSLFNCEDVLIEGLILRDSGGDGIYVGGENSGGGLGKCRNIAITGVQCINNYRQGMSITSVENMTVTHSVFRDTEGALPEAGLDIEPYLTYQEITNLRIENCAFTNNGWAGIAVALEFLDNTSPPVDIQIIDCYLSGNRRPGHPYGFTEIFLSADDDNPVQGNVSFVRTMIDGSDWTALYTRNSGAAYRSEFIDCVFKDISQENIPNNEPIFLETPSYEQQNESVGNLHFTNLVMSYSNPFTAFRVFGGGTLDGIENISGNIIVIAPEDYGIDLDDLPTTNYSLDLSYRTAYPTTSLAHNLSPTSVDECAGPAAILSLNRTASDQDLPLLVRLEAGGTATNGIDYPFLPPARILGAGESSLLTPLTARDDGWVEATESISYTIGASDCYTISSPGPAQTLISNCSAFPLPEPGIYPFGSRFGTVLYALYEEAQTAAALGWNAGHTYQEVPVSDSYFEFCTSAGLLAMARLSAEGDLPNTRSARPEATTIDEIQQQARNANLVWWDLPEELRYWRPEEMDIVREYTALTRLHDPYQRPNFMYIPGLYDSEAIENYVPYLDILPASAYPVWQEQPHAYVRWSVERTRQAITDAGYTEGPNYLDGEKTVMAILEMFPDPADTGFELSGVGTRHDYWLSLACGARGVLAFSHFYRDQSPALSEVWDALNAANATLRNSGIDQILLEGDPVDLLATVVSGPALGPSMDVDGIQVQYPSIKLSATRDSNGDLYVIAVNSASEAVDFTFGPDWVGGITVEDLETGVTTTEISATLQRNLLPLGVAVLKLTRSGDQIVSQLSSDGQQWEVYGEDFLPMGFYAEGMNFTEFPDIPQRIAAGGFNFIYTESAVESPAAYDVFFNDCAALGLYNVLGTPGSWLGDEVELFVRRYRGYPSLIAWNLMDDANDFGVSELQQQRQAILALDNARTTTASWYTSGPLQSMLPFVEVPLMQSYPWQNGNADLVAAHAVLTALADTARLLGKFPIATPQTFNWDNETYPPPAHVYCQSYLGFVTGNRGLMYYTFKDYDANSTIDVTQSAVWIQAARVADEVLNSELRDVFLYGELERTEIDFYRYYGKWTYENHYYYIVLNANAAQTYTYDIPLPADAAPLAVNIFSANPDDLSVSDGRLRGDLGPYQVAIYRITKDETILAADDGLLFDVQLEERDAVLRWSAQSAREVSSYAIEYAASGNTFELLASLEVGPSTPVFIHRDLPIGLHYYRLRLNLIDGEVRYSPIRTVERKLEVTLFPNPSRNYFTLISEVPPQQLSIYSATRQLLRRIVQPEQDISISDLPPGTYWLRGYDASGTSLFIRSFVVQ
ncbi:MAG: right-handed parallel beta-helix repeat-containing protein [Bacteroidota bacterium]